MPTTTIEQAAEIALRHYLAGRLGEAESVSRQILAAQPNHADALRVLGLVAQGVGRHDVAAHRLAQS